MNGMIINQTILYQEIIKKNKNRENESLIYVIASLGSEVPIENGQMYCGTKAYTSSCFRHLALEISHFSKIKLQAIHPGLFAKSGFIPNLPKYVAKGIGYLEFMLASSESDVDCMLSSMGNSIQCDITVFSVFAYIGYWLCGTGYVNKLLYILLEKGKPKTD